jgi:hypothetical protein
MRSRYRLFLQKKYRARAHASRTAIRISMREICVWTLLTNLLVLATIEADLTRQIEPTIAVISPRQNFGGVPARAAVEKMAVAVHRSFAWRTPAFGKLGHPSRPARNKS